MGADLEEALGSITQQRFPFATTLWLNEDGSEWTTWQQLDACLAALPKRSWPAVEEVHGWQGHLPATTVLHLTRLCPGLRSTKF